MQMHYIQYARTVVQTAFWRNFSNHLLVVPKEVAHYFERYRNYVVHIQSVKFYFNLDLELKAMHISRFKQIRFQHADEKRSRQRYGKDIFILINNVIYDVAGEHEETVYRLSTSFKQNTASKTHLNTQAQRIDHYTDDFWELSLWQKSIVLSWPETSASLY